MIGGLSNRVFLRHMYVDQVRNYGTNELYNLNLWNYCTGTIQSVTSCGKTHQSYNWAHTPTVGSFLPEQYAPGGSHSQLFTALFSLVMAGVCLSFLIWLLSFPLLFCCKQRRFSSTIMSIFTWLNFLCTIGAIVIGLVLAISFNKGVTDGWTGRAGNSIWTLLGAMGALLLGSFCYSGSCCFAGNRSRRRVGDPEKTAAAKPTFQPWEHPNPNPAGGYSTTTAAPMTTNQQGPSQQPPPIGEPSNMVRPVHIPMHQ
ncbi:hypothetical protein BX666DRAFT_1867673 [Dichotomocladium elegans]|nr:hypothetical protein BX666DRAFT_1867673 [Dichotomocladium elegans]